MCPRIVFVTDFPDAADVAREMAPSGFELSIVPARSAEYNEAMRDAEYLVGFVDGLVDGDAKMTESAGISQYLVQRYGPTPLAVSTDDPEYGVYLNWLHRSDATLTFPLTLVLRYTQLEPEEKRNPQVAEDYRRWFLARMRCVEEATADREFLCGDRFTIADVCIAYAIHLANSLGIEEVFTPNVKRYWDAIIERPAYQRAAAL